tara:strand:+ start:2459 stop:3028 length:570 start_codon:yes stop_codon:yes gene_type:complete
MKIKKLLIFFIVYLFSLITYSNLMAYEASGYKIINKNDIYEIRLYSDRIAVQAKNNNEDRSFRKLFNYISGENLISKKIDMTTPVTQTEIGNELFMQFYLPKNFNEKTTPIPSNPDVEIVTMPGGYYAVIQYSGRSSDKNFIKHRKILKKKLIDDNIIIQGTSIKATYNGPFTLPPLRRNEAMYKIKFN